MCPEARVLLAGGLAEPYGRHYGTNGVTAFLLFVDRGAFWVLPLTYFFLPISARAYLFPQSVQIPYFCSGPICVDPICPQPNGYVSPGIVPNMLESIGKSAWKSNDMLEI